MKNLTYFCKANQINIYFSSSSKRFCNFFILELVSVAKLNAKDTHNKAKIIQIIFT